MLSTLSGYRLLARDLDASLARVEAKPVVSRESAYYAANIGKAKSLDDFLGDYRLYSYAMKAYGLEDQIGSKALIRKVLQSDLTDPASFANTLADPRYRQLAAAFDFGRPAETKTALTTAQLAAITESYSEADVRASAAASKAAAGFTERVGAVSDIEGFMADPAIYEVALRSVGIDPATADGSAVRDALTGATPPASQALAALKDIFRFDASGAVASGGLIRLVYSASDVVSRYFDQLGLSGTPVAAAHEAGYFELKIATLRNVNELTFDSRLFAFALTSVGIDPEFENPAFVASVLKSDPDDPASLVNTMQATDARKAAFLKLARAFNFAADGSVPAGEKAQTAAQAGATAAGYFDNYAGDAARLKTRETMLFKAALGNPTRADALIRSDAVFDYLMTAFDLDPATESRTRILRVLKSDPSDPKSYANTLKDERYQRLAAAFNFGADGKVSTQRVVQSQASQTATAQAYTKTLGETPTKLATDNAKTATAAYAEALTRVIDIDDFVSDTAITTYALKAYGLDAETLKPADLKAILTSDLTDPESAARLKKDQRYIDFAEAYNFASNGTIKRSDGTVQSSADRLAVREAYLRQTLEEDAGLDNEGVRLALYFQRKAPTVTNAFAILADKALVELTRTALGLPAAFSQLDLDKQATIIESKLKIADLKDETKVDRLIARFAALYDTQGAGASGSGAGALAILSGGGGGNLLGYL